jgi:hypothetical protein
LNNIKVKIVMDKTCIEEAIKEWLAKRGVHSSKISTDWKYKPALHTEVECELEDETTVAPAPPVEPPTTKPKTPHTPAGPGDIDADITEIIARSRSMMKHESQEDPRNKKKVERDEE